MTEEQENRLQLLVEEMEALIPDPGQSMYFGKEWEYGTFGFYATRDAYLRFSFNILKAATLRQYHPVEPDPDLYGDGQFLAVDLSRVLLTAPNLRSLSASKGQIQPEFVQVDEVGPPPPEYTIAPARPETLLEKIKTGCLTVGGCIVIFAIMIVFGVCVNLVLEFLKRFW